MKEGGGVFGGLAPHGDLPATGLTVAFMVPRTAGPDSSVLPHVEAE